MIAVLPPDPSPDLLTAIRHEVEQRGWSWELSQGTDQSILAVSGPERLEELEALLPAALGAEVIPIQRGQHYRWLRRRRKIMHAIAWGLTLVIVCGLGFPVLTYVRSPVRGLLAPQLIRAGKAEDLAPQSSRLVRQGNSVLMLVRLEGQRFFALGAVCTHMNDCQLEFDRARLQIICPCHGGVWDLYGNVVEGPPSIPLPSYRIERAGDEILIRTGV